MKPIVQISLDFTDIGEALEMARVAVEAGVDWLEAGTPLLLGEGVHAIRALRRAFPDHPIVADLKAMDGGYLEVAMAAEAGATHAVVMAAAHPATVRAAVKAARKHGIALMGDIMATPDPVAAAKMLEANGIDYIIVHTGYDERTEDPERTPFDYLQSIIQAVSVPVQAVGGLTIEQAAEMPKHGAPLVVIGAPLVVYNQELKTSTDRERMKQILQQVVAKVKAG